MAKKGGNMLFVTYFLICHPCSLYFAPMVWCPGPLYHYYIVTWNPEEAAIASKWSVNMVPQQQINMQQ